MCGVSRSSSRYRVRIDGVAMNTSTRTGSIVHINSRWLASVTDVLYSFVVVVVARVNITDIPIIIIIDIA